MRNPLRRDRPSETPEERAARLEAQARSGPAIPTDQYKRTSRRALLVGGAAIAAGAFGWRWVQTQPTDGRVPTVLRRGYEVNEALWTRLSSNSRSAPSFALADATPLRVNGRIGIRDEIDLDDWRLEVRGLDDEVLDTLDLADVDDLPNRYEEVEQVVEHKCIEGWSNVTHWTGIRFADFARTYADAMPDGFDYVALATPDMEYYVGLDARGMLHPQTLLCYGLEGERLTQPHGAPLRLVMPNYYGIKSIKRIGSITFTDQRPEDYWAERGYDWYSGF